MTREKKDLQELCIIEQIYGIIHLSVHIHVSAPPPSLHTFILVVPSLSPLSLSPPPLGAVGFLPIIIITIITASCGGVTRRNVVFLKGRKKGKMKIRPPIISGL